MHSRNGFRGFLGVSPQYSEWFKNLARHQCVTGDLLGFTAETEVTLAFDYLHREETGSRDLWSVENALIVVDDEDVNEPTVQEGPEYIGDGFRFITFTEEHKQSIDELLGLQRAARMVTNLACMELGGLDALIEEIGGKKNIASVQTAESYIKVIEKIQRKNRQRLLG